MLVGTSMAQQLNLITRYFSYRNLRYKYPSDEEIYVAQLTDSNDDTLNFHLTNGQDNQLTMSIFSVNTGVIRVIIEEPDNHRYHLINSLQDEPIKQV